MSDTDRALLSERQRREARTNPRGVPSQQDEDTDPSSVLRRDVDSADLDILRRMGRDPDEPFTMSDFVIWQRTDKRHREEQREEHRSGNRELEQKLLDFLNRPPDESTLAIQNEIRDLKHGARIVKWALGVVLTAALGSLGVGLSALWSRAEREGEINVTLQRLKTDVDQLLREERSHTIKDLQP